VAYGVGKAAVDRMAADCAVELKKQNVAMISLWPGPVRTEYVAKNVTSACEFTINLLQLNSTL
jgi:dehydrogenase/reductase SDR family protein 1